MKKSDRIQAFVSSLPADSAAALDPRYQGYFTCFNQALYYEAHDVLEDLWLQCKDANHLFYKGLIQIAGAFVHLQKQFNRPDHPKDGRRLHPAVRLFRLGVGNIQPYGPLHMRLDIHALCQSCNELAGGIVASDFTVNPWAPERAPMLSLLPAQ